VAARAEAEDTPSNLNPQEGTTKRKMKMKRRGM
jgi:hypothetical protein